ncbi:hypothetical protein ACI6PS_03485 [Flavobacterium sp. PLA-1-15]|uniref:hypothetical protein n=1 Tax=Flavobacterium sp. PLA-1-15 TaxID=3380533 RepID=UPI003B77A1B6
MINKRQKQKIIKAFGNNYSQPIILLLNRAKITNRDGNPYSSESIRHIVGGNRNNERVEKKILSAAEKKLSKTRV